MPIPRAKSQPANTYRREPPAPFTWQRHSTATGGFTLIELLVTISIIGILLSMLMVTFGLVRSSLRSVVCQSNLRQLAIASTAYVQDHKGFWPMSWWDTKPHFWGMRIGEYVEGFSGIQYRAGKRPPTPFGCPESKWIPPPNTDDFGSDYGKNVFAGGYGYNDWIPIKRMATYPAATTIGYGDGEGGITATMDGDRELAPWCGPTWGLGFWRHRGLANAVFLDCHTQSLKAEPLNFTFWDADPWNIRWP